jgi:predicted lipoprotein
MFSAKQFRISDCSTTRTALMKRVVVILGSLLLAVGLIWVFPLFHVVRLDKLQAAQQQASFNATDFVESFWKEQLLPSLDEAVDAATVLAAFDDDSQSARGQYGRKVGVGRKTLLLLHGTGRVVNVDKNGVGITLTNGGTEPDIVLHTGLLFDNTARDATGLLDASSFANSQQFNEISTELNKVIEARVIPTLKEKATPGLEIQFVGCAEVSDTVSDLRPLTVIPLDVSIE